MTFTFLDGDDLICSVELSVAQLIKKRGVNHWYHCRHEGKDSGQVSLNVEYTPEEGVEEPEKEEETSTAAAANIMS